MSKIKNVKIIAMTPDVKIAMAEYDKLKIRTFSEYYVNHVGERWEATDYERFLAKWHRLGVDVTSAFDHHLEREYHIGPAPRIGIDNIGDSAVFLADATHSFIRLIDEDTAEIQILSTYRGQKYLDMDEESLRLVPVIYGGLVLYTRIEETQHASPDCVDSDI